MGSEGAELLPLAAVVLCNALFEVNVAVKLGKR